MQNGLIGDSKEIVIFGHGQHEDSLAFLVFTNDEELRECSALSKPEQTMLDQCEQIIQRDHEAFVQCGEALGTVKRGKLYREKYKSFKQYCMERWGFGPAQANRLIQAANTMEDLQQSLEAKELSLPKTERELRPLTGLDAEQRLQALKLANELAGTRRRTGKHVEQAVAQLFGIPDTEDEAAENTGEYDNSHQVIVETAPVVIEKPIITPEQLFDLIEDIRTQIDEIGTMQAVVNQLGTLRSMLKTFIDRSYPNTNENN